MSEQRYPVPVQRSLTPVRRDRGIAAVAARHLAPAASESARALVATLAIEQTLARAVTLALGRVGRAVAATPFSVIVPERRGVEQRLITVVTETTIIERIVRRS